MEGLEPPEFPPLGPFATLYEEWIDAYPGPRDPAIEQRLAATYRNAWASGDPKEQLYVLYFVQKRMRPSDAPLVVEALGNADGGVAGWAAAMAGVWMHKGLDLGPEPILVEAWRDLVLRHPMEDVTRPDEFRRPGDSWPEGRPFIQLYERWMSDAFPPRS